MLLSDFHIHSTFSDGRLTIPQIVDFYGQQNFDVIAITDHICDEGSFLGKAAHFLDKSLSQETFPHYIETIEQEAERARVQYNMLVLPGAEYTKNSLFNSRSAHILGIGTRKFIDPKLPAENLCEEIRKQGGISVAAHPVWTRRWEPQTFLLWDRRWELNHLFDAWEVASGAELFDEVAQSGLPMLANSDLHHPRQIRSWKTLLETKKNELDVLQGVKSQSLKFHFFEESRQPAQLYCPA